MLTANDPEPSGIVVRDALGRLWERTDDGDRDGAANWERVGATDHDPQSWNKIAGNYGPVEAV